MKVFDVTTNATDVEYYQLCVVAADMAAAEKMVNEYLSKRISFAAVEIREIKLHNGSPLISDGGEKVDVRLELLSANLKVMAIKQLREVLKNSLQESKEIVAEGKVISLSQHEFSVVSREMSKYCKITVCE